MAAPLPNPLRVLAVSRDEQSHAPVRALLRHAQIDLVSTPDDALAMVRARAHDIVLVDREIQPPTADGLKLAEDMVVATPTTPVPLFPRAAMVPATWVPWPWSSIGSLSWLPKS